MLMAYAGKPQGEAAGLVRDDIKLKYEVPHVYLGATIQRTK